MSLGRRNLSLSSLQLPRSPLSRQLWNDITETHPLPTNTLTRTLTTPIPTITITTTIIILSPTQQVCLLSCSKSASRAKTDLPFCRLSFGSSTSISSRSRSSRRSRQDDSQSHWLSWTRSSLSPCSYHLSPILHRRVFPKLRRVDLFVPPPPLSNPAQLPARRSHSRRRCPRFSPSAPLALYERRRLRCSL